MKALHCRVVSGLARVALAAGVLAFGPMSSADPSSAGSARVLGDIVHASDGEELRYRVLRALVDRFAAAEGITVSAVERDRFIARQQQAMRLDTERREREREDLGRELADGNLSQPQREQLARRLESLDTLLAGARSATPDTEDERRARETAAEAFVLQWKIDRALYRRYGGRIVFQQGGPEPLDARRAFLEEAQARGDFVITDAALAEAFWRYYRDDSIHSFYPPDSPETRRLFETPWWEVDAP